MYDLSNCITNSIGFEYPVESVEVERVFSTENHEILIRLCTLLFASKKPKVQLAAILMAAGVDVGIYVNRKNTTTDVAKALGESKQNFSALVKQIQKDYNLVHSNSGKTEASAESFKQSNVRKKNYD